MYMTQDQALAILESGQSVLLTGAAGTGKTYLLRKFIRRARLNGKAVSVTATTGLAATHLNGATLHAWAGIGVHDELPKNHLQKISKQRRDIILKTDILIIDEISMLHDFRFDMVDAVLKFVRQKPEPFGGVQVVVCGDFFQLPPVNRSDSKSGGFITESQVWKDNFFTVCYLQTQYRQANDEHYRDILNGIRSGVLTRRQLDSLQSRSQAHEDPFTVRTRLLTTNADVDTINLEHLSELSEDIHEYTMYASGGKAYIEQLKRSCLAPEVLSLKKGAVVMCIKNSPDKKYVNGSLGIIEDFDKHSDYPLVRLNTGKLISLKPETWELIDGDKHRASLVQLPLRLAWAITVHKSQGMTLDAARIDLRKAFVEGMGYVALSRVKGLQSLILDGLNNMALRVSPTAKQIDGELQSLSEQAAIDNQACIETWVKDKKGDPIAEKLSESKPWAEKLEKMRKEYPNAYRPWTKDDDTKLQVMYQEKSSLLELSGQFGRHPGSILKRLQKHFGEDIKLD
ncbi:MAG: PIF1 family ATP-dependent DNA helicase [Candidatus Saccharimonadales bacterium]